MSTGKKMFGLIKELMPINRSLTGKGNRETLKILKRINPNLKKYEIKSGKKVFDWKVPMEWNVKTAFLKNYSKNKIVADFKHNNLHLMGYSRSIMKLLTFQTLKKKLNYLENFPEAIPYTTSYYAKDWGFNISYNEFKKLNRADKYLVNIKTEFKKGSMSYGEILVRGKSKKEIVFSTYICHPSMANNELSGPVLSVYLSKWIQKKKNNYYSYRFIFIPETIGSISYIYRNLNRLKNNVLAIINLTCVGDSRKTSFLPTKYQNTFLDKIIFNYFKSKKIKFSKYNWSKRGSDERQYMSALINIPTISIMSSKYHTYKEYHTSKDDLNFISIKGLNKNYQIHKNIINIIDKSRFPISKIYCEPNLGKRNLYPKKSLFKKKEEKKLSKNLLSFLSFSDGTNTLEDISNYCKFTKKYNMKIYKILNKHNLINK